MPANVRLVRHLPVAKAWSGRCYGASDVGLSRAAVAALPAFARQLAEPAPGWVVHSGLSRCERLASRIATLARCSLLVDAGWRERDFGDWEGKSWRQIYRTTGNAMDGMIDAPDQFRPGGGETTHELAERVRRAWRRLPAGDGIVISHGGPIASLLGLRQGLAARDWLPLVPKTGAWVDLEGP